ncbi:MAG TPA: glycoside hydrolase [Firmicutes bacterium]|nr:glycoside hydrolase [Bacillota bacterium]
MLRWSRKAIGVLEEIIGAVIIVTVLWLSRPSSACAGTLLKIGSQGETVRSVQYSLSKLGYYFGPVDGKFGPATNAAVIKFQKASGLKPDGLVGNATLQALQRASGVSSRSSTAHKSGSSPAPAASGQQVADIAKTYLNTRYVWGGTTPKGFDCSGFVYYVLNASGIKLSRDIAVQYRSGESVKKENLAPGDLVFFTTYAPGPSHVGIYIGDGQFIHASSAGGKVIITPLNKPYYTQRWIGARRVVK